MRRALPHLAAVAWLSLLAAVLLWPALSGRASVVPQNLLAFDPLYRTAEEVPGAVYADNTMVVIDVPRDTTFARELWAGRLSVWNPFSACGAPLWAEQGGPFTPFKLPFYLAPSRQSYALFLALRLIVAGIGAYALARYRGLGWLGGLAAGVAFELSGAMIEQLPFGSASATPLLPWAVLGAEAIAAGGTRRAVAGSALALGIAGHGGHPTVSALVFAGFAAALGGHVLARLRRPRDAVALAGKGLVALLIGVALAAPVLLPLVELRTQATSYKDRPEGDEAWRVELAKTRVTAPLALLAPGVLRIMYADVGPEHEAAGALGVTVAVLAGAGLLTGALSPALAALALAGVAITFVPPLLGWLVHALPGVRLILPEYAWPLITLPLTQAAGRGAQEITTRAGLRAAAASLAGFAAALLALVLIGPGHFPFYVWNPFRIGFPTRFRQVLGSAEGLAALLVPLALATAAVAIAAWVVHRRRRARSGPPSPAPPPRWVPALVVALAAIEMLVLWRPTLRHPFVGVDMDTEPPPAVELLQRELSDPHWRMTAMPLVAHPMSGMLFGLPDVRGVSALAVVRLREYLALIDPAGNPMTYQQVAPQRSPLYDLAAARYVAAWRLKREPAPHLDGDPELPLIFQTPYAAIYENRAALPRVRVVHRSEAVPDAAAARARLGELIAGAAHAGETALAELVLLEPAADGTPPPVLDGAASGSDRVRIVDASDPDALRLEAELARDGLVVIADTYYPGWEARVDGAAAPIFPANALFRAVPVPAGAHTVELVYRPASLRWGFAACGVALALCAALLSRAR